jgi:AAA+ superfamily predicted ATPase
MARIDVLVHREVRRWQLAGQDPSDAFRGLHVSDAEAAVLLERPFAMSWGQTVALKPNEATAFANLQARAARRAELLAEAANREGHTPRLLYLAEAFGLDRFDLDTLLVCLAPTLDLRYERLYAYLQDDVTRQRPRVNLVLDLLCEPDATRRMSHLQHFADDAPLFKYDLLDWGSEPGQGQPPLLSQALSVDPAIVSWLLGGYEPHNELGPCASLLRPEENEADALLSALAGPDWERALTIERPIVVFYGPDQVGQLATARMMAAKVGHPLLQVDLATITRAGIPQLRALRLALRDARLNGAIPCLVGWDAFLESTAPAPSKDEGPVRSFVEGSSPPADLLAELCAHPDLVIVAGSVSWRPGGIDRARPMVWLEFPIPPYAQRYALWEHYLGREAIQTEQPGSSAALDIESLAGQFSLSSGGIRDTVASARDLAVQESRPLQSADLFAAARAHSNPRLGSLARKIEPRYSWHDIVLPEDQLDMLREIVATVRGRPLVLDEWGVGQKLASSAGVTILFSGPPGTGKTMAAEIIAQELGLDLYKIDLSSIVSKYIGETEKNLERIFNEAQSSNAILFFDEADAIFGKRSEVKDAHDRYANIEVSYLLQRMEMYDGVTMLATNLRANLDEAFTRRLQFAVDFPFPDRHYRLRIWETLFPPQVPHEPDLDFEPLARRFKLAGGNIRNILVSAAYLAAADGRVVTMKHLLHGTRRELQKMGRLVDERDMIL